MNDAIFSDYLSHAEAATLRDSTAAEPAENSRSSIANCDTLLIANGYEPVAVEGKRALGVGWSTRPNTSEAVVAERAALPGAINTGLRTGHLVGVDIDIIAPNHVTAVKALAVEMLGVPGMVRIGAKGAMLCYRNAGPIGKITVKGKGHPSRPDIAVEILGTGQQFVAYGDHPGTGKPYDWPAAAFGSEPLQTPFADLPEVTPEQLRDFADWVATAFTAWGYPDIKITGAGSARAPTAAPADVTFDHPETIAWARQQIAADLAEHGEPVEGEASDNRTYQLANRLIDGDRYGYSLNPETVVDRLAESWAGHFDREWIEAKVESALRHRQEPAGCGQGGSPDRRYGDPVQYSEGQAPSGPVAKGDYVSTVAASEDDLAVGFAHQFAHCLRYVDEWGHWLLFDDRRWTPVPMPGVWNLARPGLRDYVARLTGDGWSASTRRKLLSRATITGMEALARGDLLAPADQFDAAPWLLNTPAGIIDLRTGELHRADPLAYCTKMTAVAPGGDCPLWRKFLAEVTGDDTELQAYLQRVVGYSLIGQVIEHVLVFLYGTGGNGKGVFLGTLLALLGDYAKVAPIDMFTETNGDRHPTDMAMLRGMRFVTAQETDEGRAWAEPKIKTLTGGDKISARFMRQDFFEYTPQFTLLIAGNHKPKLRTVDEAMRRRLHLVPFTITIADPDTGLPDKLKAEWPGILRWAIEGCREWQRIGLAPPPAVVDMTASYLADQDALAEWIEARCVLTPDAWTARAALFADYAAFKRQAGEQPEAKGRFWEMMERQGCVANRPINERGYLGIALRDDDITY